MKKIFFVNCLESGHDLLRGLIEKGIEIHHIVSLHKDHPAAPSVSGYKSFEDLSHIHGIPLYHAERYNLKSSNDIRFFQREKPFLMLVHGWQRLIPKDILDCCEYAFNDHGSHKGLPWGRGRSPMNWSLIEGFISFKLHLLRMDAGVDSGEIIDTTVYGINRYDTIRTLYFKKTVALERMLLKHIPLALNGKLKSVPQQGTPSYYPKRTPEDGWINWDHTPEEIHNFIRAQTKPYPGAFTHAKDKFYIWHGQPFDGILEFGGKPGEVLKVFCDGSFLVKTNPGSFLVTEADLIPKKGTILS